MTTLVTIVMSLFIDKGLASENSTSSHLEICFEPRYDILVAVIWVCLLAFQPVLGLEESHPIACWCYHHIAC